jgi:hypothetical protein
VSTEHETEPETVWLGLGAAARLSEYDPATLHRAEARGELIAVRVGGRRVFAEEDVRAWAAARRGGGTAQ